MYFSLRQSTCFSRLRRLAPLWCLAICGPLVASQVQADEFAPGGRFAGWLKLFDGETLFGWQPQGSANWRVSAGSIVADAGDPGFLMTTTQFSDFELHLQFRGERNTNSGIFILAEPGATRPPLDCYELNIAPPENPFPTGSLVNRLKVDLDPDATHAWDGKWHTYDVHLSDGKLTVRLDGLLITQYQDPKPLGRGRIALQFREGPIAFRDVRIKPLGTRSLFNGRDLSGWSTAGAGPSRFEVTPEGELRILNGRGQLESEGKYGDFVLQLECRVDGDGLNSGVFFRCIPGDQMMGYECQIHNAFHNGDPTQPVDCGTGGIFRRQNARRVVSQDHQWFAKTLIAHGNHMAVWVNGYQVTDWSDDRPPHKNPRNGLRLEPGTLMIQGHDPTTDLRMRRIEVAELPPRTAP